MSCYGASTSAVTAWVGLILIALVWFAGGWIGLLVLGGVFVALMLICIAIACVIVALDKGR